MAKDRRSTHRHVKPVSKRQFAVRMIALAGAVAAAVAAIVLCCVLTNPSSPVDGTPPGPVATTTAVAPTTTQTATVDPSTQADPSAQTTTPPATRSSTQPLTQSPTQSPGGNTDENADTKPTTKPPAVPADGHYVQPDGASWNLRLVNPWNRMTQEQSDELPIVRYGGGSCDSRIVEALDAMLSDGSRYGLYVTSGYRAYSLQAELYENKIGRVQAQYGCSYDEAAEIAATEVARPGTSEHNTGLAVDLLYSGCSELERYWEDGEAFDWLMAHCAEYGFILRFPDGQQEITGVIYEPWHYRYVGVEAAREIMGRGITLEQYLQEHGL